MKPVLIEWGEGGDTDKRWGQEGRGPGCDGINVCPVLLTLIELPIQILHQSDPKSVRT